MEFSEWNLDVLAEYIEDTHHQFCSQQIQIILPVLTQKKNDFWPKISELFQLTAAEMAVHMKKEELLLFPFIKKMVKMERELMPWTPPRFETVGNPIELMLQDHSKELKRFDEISFLTEDYKISTDESSTEILDLLKAFHQDLIQHIHLENDILFPKALTLEEKLSQS